MGQRSLKVIENGTILKFGYDFCHIYMSVDLAEASSRVLVDTALWFTVSESRDWSDSRAWPPFCLARQTTGYVAGDPHVLDVRFVSI